MKYSNLYWQLHEQKSHFNPVTCRVQCRQIVQTLQTSDSVIGERHTNALECEMSPQYCYIYAPLTADCSSTLFHIVPLCSEGLSTHRLFSLLCTKTLWPSSGCISRVSLLSWERFFFFWFPDQVWSFYTVSKVLLNRYQEGFFNHWENKEKRMKVIAVICDWDAVSLCWTCGVVAASVYILIQPLWTMFHRAEACGVITAI